ncbi:MAG: 50S ribosomal protein L29 [Candidatus Micrarchaeota archaeon]|nr:50S ribosomal protein L29 [Candidatus Micrarchaeota archaeon]
MRIKEVRALSNDALQARIKEIRLEMGIEKKSIAATGVASKKVKIREMRRTLAKMLTILGERGVKN